MPGESLRNALGVRRDVVRPARVPVLFFHEGQRKGLVAWLHVKALALGHGHAYAHPERLGLQPMDQAFRQAMARAWDEAVNHRPVLGGGPNTELGHLYYQPTILLDAEPGSEILTEEVFGPVLTIQTFTGEEQAVEVANDTRFGLAATLVTGDPTRVTPKCRPPHPMAGTVFQSAPEQGVHALPLPWVGV